MLNAPSSSDSYDSSSDNSFENTFNNESSSDEYTSDRINIRKAPRPVKPRKLKGPKNKDDLRDKAIRHARDLVHDGRNKISDNIIVKRFGVTNLSIWHETYDRRLKSIESKKSLLERRVRNSAITSVKRSGEVNIVKLKTKFKTDELVNLWLTTYQLQKSKSKKGSSSDLNTEYGSTTEHSPDNVAIVPIETSTDKIESTSELSMNGTVHEHIFDDSKRMLSHNLSNNSDTPEVVVADTLGDYKIDPIARLEDINHALSQERSLMEMLYPVTSGVFIDQNLMILSQSPAITSTIRQDISNDILGEVFSDDLRNLLSLSG